MDLLTKRKRFKTYIGEEMKGKYLYFCEDDKRHKCHYIVYLKDIINDEKTVTYVVEKGKIFKMPHDKNGICYIFEAPKEIEISIYNTDVYELTWDEYIHLFKSFIDYEGTICKNVPEKLL